MAIFISRFLLAVTLVLMLGSSAVLAEQIDNPAYTSWAKFKPGSVLKTNTQSMIAGQKLSIEMTSKLLEVTPEKVIVEVTTETTTGQMKLPSQVRKQDVPAKLTKPANRLLSSKRARKTSWLPAKHTRVASQWRRAMALKLKRGQAIKFPAAS